MRHVGWIAALVLGLAGCMDKPHAQTADVITSRIGLPYGPLPAEQGDLFLPQGVTAPPVVLVIHGGGWVAGDRSSAAGLAKLIASHGVAAFNIDYRLANAAQPDTRWPAQIVDAQLAIRWIRAHAAELGVDGARIGAVGDSAGAHLALLLGVLPQNVPGDQAGLWPGQSPNVSVVGDQFGPTDVASLPAWARGTYPALFGSQAPAPGDVASMSPLPGITSKSAPVLIIQGDHDVVVPPAQSLMLQSALRRQGVHVDYIRYPGDHGFGGLDGQAIGGLQQKLVNWLAVELRH